jgi:hypothetical protein
MMILPRLKTILIFWQDPTPPFHGDAQVIRRVALQVTCGKPGVQRKDLEVFGSTLFVDRLGRRLNNKG